MRNTFTLLLASLLTFGQIAAQSVAASAADILHQLQKLQNTSRVLYLAAHPDDENTRMISWLENDRHIRTAYLSLTRGDGGQNLIGTELGAELGVLRTQELMQARAIDGGEQYFTRAVDFGYSKTADETFRQWDRDQVLADVVWVIRTYQPDVIITRFPPDARGGHGHHTASAMLALEAFDLAADEAAYPEQLAYTDPWQVKRLFWNHSTWWRQNLDSIAAADDRYTVVDVGSYNGLLGMSCNELASHSRTQHKSQGFGVSVRRGSTSEYLQLLKGDKVSEEITDGIPSGWARYGWPEGDKMLASIIQDFDPAEPWSSIPQMLDILERSAAIQDDRNRQWFQSELKQIIASALGLHLEIIANREYVSGNSEQQLQLEIINRSPMEVKLLSVRLNDQDLLATKREISLSYNALTTVDIDVAFPEEISQPYWLARPYDKMFTVTDQELIGQPENKNTLPLELSLVVEGKKLTFEPEPLYKFTDRVEGEIKRPVVITPGIVVNASESNLVFVDDQPQVLDLEIRNFSGADQQIQLDAQGWQFTPEEIELSATDGDGWQNRKITVAPGKNDQAAGELKLLANGQELHGLTEIDYPHIDKRVVFKPVRVKLVQLNLKKRGERIGYIKGAGDRVPDALRQMGYEVQMLNREQIMDGDLSQFQAIVAGIRAYNTQDWLPGVQEQLMHYVENGGNYIVQYNTASRDLRYRDFGPFPFTLSRERVTEEDAAVEFLLPGHPVLNEPNKIDNRDFDFWVQERGLYFASDWDEAYDAPIGWHDEGEPTRAGGLLIAEKGKGSFMYTGISFFRELPAGVAGAYRLLANLVSYQNPDDE